MKLAIVTCTTNLERSRRCRQSWIDTARTKPNAYCYVNGGDEPYLGTVPAFQRAVDMLLDHEYGRDYDVIACLHDDLEIHEPGWDEKVLRYFERNPDIGLAGFGGAIGLGSDDLYVAPYKPDQLARQGFRSDLTDAEKHGIRSLLPEQVACLDGFSQIGRRQFWEGFTRKQAKAINKLDAIAQELAGQLPDGFIGEGSEALPTRTLESNRPWTEFANLGIIHHAYDGMLGCIAARDGWKVWYIPVRCTHYGGQTAVGDSGYQEWAKTQHPEGDHGLWEQAHRIWYETYKGVLPIRV